VIVRLYAEGHSAREVAEAVNASIGEVYAVMSRFRKEVPEWFRDGPKINEKNCSKVPSKNKRGKAE
jgi:transposase